MWPTSLPGPGRPARVRVPESLRHRGGFLSARPDASLLEVLGGEAGVRRLVDELYDRIGADPLLRRIFPHPDKSRDAPKRFFVEWLGGERAYSGVPRAGLSRAHHHHFVSPRAAAAWLRCMAEALDACGVERGPVMRLVAPVAAALVNRQDVDPGDLIYRCGFMQDAPAARLEEALEDVARGRTEEVQRALADDPALATGRGMHGQTLLWLAVYKNRTALASRLLAADANPNLPACDPPRGEIAGNAVRPGTIVSVTPLAVALRHRPKLVTLLQEHGALSDVFTAAWTGDLQAVQDFLERDPALLDISDPAEDFQDVTPLAHAIAGGNIAVVRFLLERGAAVRPHSRRLLDTAILLNRSDLVELLLEHGADAAQATSLGPLDPQERPIAELLLSHGGRVPDTLLPRACRADVSSNELHRVRVLLDYGADVNARGREGLTALHYAVRSGKLPLIELLLERGADPAALAPDGSTPADQLARSRAKLDRKAVLSLLASHGAASA